MDAVDGGRLRPVLVRALAGLAVAIGLVALVGWLMEVDLLRSVRPGLAQMKPNTAIAGVLSGVSLWVAVGPSGTGPDGPGWDRASRMAAGLVTVLSGVTLAQYLFGWSLGIDEVLFRDDPTSPLTSHPGRMAPNTAASFTLLGGSLLTLGWGPRRGIPPAQWLGFLAASIAFAAMVGYLYSLTVMYRLASFTGMALNTTVVLLLVSVGVLFARPDSLLTRIVGLPGPGGRSMRVLLPAVVGLPLLLGWLRLVAERSGYLRAETGVAVMVAALVLLLTLALHVASSETEEAEQARTQGEELLRSAVAAAPHGMLMVEPGGSIVLANRQTEAIFGYGTGELVGRPVETLLPSDRRAAHVELRTSFTAAPEARRMGSGRDLRGRRKDGGEIPVEVGLSPVERPDGTFVLASVVDITERKEMEEELRRSNEELERFAYVASHDLQEPLRMVGSYVQLLARRYEGRLDADADDFIGYALEGAVRAQELIHGLLEFSRVGTRGGALVPVDADVALDRALASLALSVRESGAQVTRDPLPEVVADDRQLERIFLNLLSNALKYHGGGPPEIHVGAERRGRLWELSVRDRGIGIEEEYFERIFVIFQRLHGRGEYPGTGMGLALAKKIVERHGGGIRVESTPGEGSTFFFTLPAVPEQAA